MVLYVSLLVGVKWCLMVVTDIFLVTHDAKHLFTCFLAVSASSGVVCFHVVAGALCSGCGSVSNVLLRMVSVNW